MDNIIEVVIPVLLTKYNSWKMEGKDNKRSGGDNKRSGDDNSRPQWVSDFQLEMQTKFSLFYQYEEIVLQYGFVTMFVAGNYLPTNNTFLSKAEKNVSAEAGGKKILIRSGAF